MGFAPLLDTFHVLVVAEVFSVGWLTEPPPLTGRFTGATTIRCATENLPSGIMPVRNEERFAAAALASGVLGTHREPSGKKTKPLTESKNGFQQKEKNRRRKKNFHGQLRRKSNRRRRNFRPPVFPHFHFAADTPARAFPNFCGKVAISVHTPPLKSDLGFERAGNSGRFALRVFERLTLHARHHPQIMHKHRPSYRQFSVCKSLAPDFSGAKCVFKNCYPTFSL